jgi:uncharacterized protein YndB with AHSA1/START domain
VLKKILLVAAALLAVLLLVILTRPATYSVVRKAKVAAPPAEVYARLADFHRWEAWSPWAKLDPSMRTDFSGSDGTPGASYHWIGNDKVGEGRMTVLQTSPPERVVIKLEFMKPFASVATTTFTLAPAGHGTEVAWLMEGENSFMGKAMVLVGGMDAMIGRDFEKGLAQLKAAAEAKAP